MSDEFPVADAIRLDEFKHELQQERPVRTTQRSDVSTIFNSANHKRNRSSSASNRQKLKTYHESGSISMDQESHSISSEGVSFPQLPSFNNSILRSASSDKDASFSMALDKIVSDNSPMDTGRLTRHLSSEKTKSRQHSVDSQSRSRQHSVDSQSKS